MGDMKERVQHTAILRFFSSRLFFVVAGVLILFIVIADAKAILRRKQVSQEITQLKSEIAQLEKSQEGFNNVLEYLQSEEFIKQEAKIKFGMRNEGERVIVLHDTQDTRRAVDTSELEPQNANISNPRKWMIYFFGTN
ncbi:septum formation initiator family protein [Candidatus Falkowbacteria bacterium]|nr:septum formation initiator family protein [Candidatus Falkowbacteria bacterium]